MKTYIHSAGVVSPHISNQFDQTGTESIPQVQNGHLFCHEPDYKEFINPMVSRRMSRMVKMGIYAAKTCLTRAGIEMPDAIITGTGLGCIEDTEKFLISVIENDEKLLNPTPFIQSTHNTVSSQISLFLKCHGYNVTYSHRGFSFESALLDSVMMISEGMASSVLTGGVDELTQHSFHLQTRLGIWNNSQDGQSQILSTKTRGNLAGEGAVFFLLSDKPCDENNVMIHSPSIIHETADEKSIIKLTKHFLESKNMNFADIDVFMAGYGGDASGDKLYDVLSNEVFSNSAVAFYKHLCGDYMTSSAFAMALGNQIIKSQKLPDIINVNRKHISKINNVLIYNHFLNMNHCFLLLQNV